MDRSAKSQFYWGTLKTIEQAAATLLGWTPRTWEEGMDLNRDIYWNTLTEEKQNAVLILGYTPNEWNQEIEKEFGQKAIRELRVRNRQSWEESDAFTQMQSCIENFHIASRNELMARKINSRPTEVSKDPPELARQPGNNNLSVFAPFSTSIPSFPNPSEMEDSSTFEELNDYFHAKENPRRDLGKHSNSKKQVRYRAYSMEKRLGQSTSSQNGEETEDKLPRKWNAFEDGDQESEVSQDEE